MLKKSLALVYQPPSNAGHSQNHKIDTLKISMGSAARQVGILRTGCSRQLRAERQRMGPATEGTYFVSVADASRCAAPAPDRRPLPFALVDNTQPGPR